VTILSTTVVHVSALTDCILLEQQVYIAVMNADTSKLFVW
jgi:hypothetical protein